jgi:uncharacterized membrane protein
VESEQCKNGGAKGASQALMGTFGKLMPGDKFGFMKDLKGTHLFLMWQVLKRSDEHDAIMIECEDSPTPQVIQISPNKDMPVIIVEGVREDKMDTIGNGDGEEKNCSEVVDLGNGKRIVEQGGAWFVQESKQRSNIGLKELLGNILGFIVLLLIIGFTVFFGFWGFVFIICLLIAPGWSRYWKEREQERAVDREEKENIEREFRGKIDRFLKGEAGSEEELKSYMLYLKNKLGGGS